MTFGFERGRIYNRRADIHARFGGQQQGGIITPANHPLVILVSSEGGLEHGYADRYRDDGVYEYFGEGQTGDMSFRAGNKAVAEHSANGKALLLFRREPRGLRFEGEMVLEGFHYERAPDRNGAMRQAIVFELRSLDTVVGQLEQEAPRFEDSIEILRARAFAAAVGVTDVVGKANRTVYQRSKDVRDYVLARAAGVCEGCRQEAPFRRVDCTPYLETHHLLRVSDGGPDHPSHVIALCPNCHRRVHAGADGKSYNDALMAATSTIEQSAIFDLGSFPSSSTTRGSGAR